MGIFLGLAAAFWFGAATVLARRGMRTGHSDNGHYLSIVVNVILLGAIGLFVGKPDWSTTGVVALAVAGLIGVVVGRFSNFRAIREIGPTRATVFLTGTPMVAAVAGWIALDEALGIIDGLGGAFVIIGLFVLTSSRSRAAPVPGSDTSAKSHITGYLYAAAAPTAFGLAYVARKWGLREYDSAILGAFIGAAAALAFLTLGDAVRRRIRTRFRDNFSSINVWFLGAGIALTFALISQFSAFSRIPAWVVGALQGTQALWVLLLGYLFMRSEERIDRAVVLSVLLVGIGVVLISVAI